MKSVLFSVLILCFLIGGGCLDQSSSGQRSANDAAVEKIRLRLSQEEFDEVYNESSSTTRAQLTRDEFVTQLKSAVQILKSIDPELDWRRDERGSPEIAVYRDDNWSALVLERAGRRVDIQLDWEEGRFRLCGMLISGDVPNGGVRVFRSCD